MQLGLHINDFNWPGGSAAIGPTLTRVAQSAEAAGFARITVMDHLWQIGAVGAPEEPMLEGYSTLGFLAAKTETITLHTMVTAATYRSPGLLAKTVATLDVLSGGRVMLGLGAGWFEEEAAGLGLDLPSVSERFERMEETLQICLQMWSGEQGPYEGKHYRLGRTLNSPAVVASPRPKIMIGGSGERKTLRMVAQYADSCNIYFGQDIAAKLAILQAHCDRLGRDSNEIEKTSTLQFDVGSKGERVDELLQTLRSLHEHGMTLVYGRMKAQDYTDTLDIFAREIVPAVASW